MNYFKNLAKIQETEGQIIEIENFLSKKMTTDASPPVTLAYISIKQKPRASAASEQ